MFMNRKPGHLAFRMQREAVRLVELLVVSYEVLKPAEYSGVSDELTECSGDRDDDFVKEHLLLCAFKRGKKNQSLEPRPYPSSPTCK